MPKYAQTLTANSYNEIDFSNRLKEAFDNLGWGTGKVDILGGYRFTATDQANSVTTPLVISGESFLENHHGKNIIRPTKSDSAHRPAQVLSMYLPGVKRFRLKYTLRSSAMTAGTPFVIDNISQQITANYVAPNTSARGSYGPVWADYAKSIALHTTGSSLIVGTQFTSDWIGNDEIVGIIGVSFRFNGSCYITIESVEYEVSQNKFAWQSPNLDSPSFESFTKSIGGNLWSCVSTLPIKAVKTPIVKISPYYYSSAAYRHDTTSFESRNAFSNLAQAHSTIFSTEASRTERGYMLSSTCVDIITYSNYGKDVSIHAGCNTSFDGFYLLTRQDSSWNGTVWDTVDKASAFPNTSPQFPSSRKTITTALGSYNDGVIADYSSWSEGGKSYDIFRVKNQTQLSAVQLRYSGNDDSSYRSVTTKAILYKATQDPESKKFKATEKLVDIDLSTQNAMYNTIQNFPTNITLTPGLYLIASTNDRQKIQTANRDHVPGIFPSPISSTRNIEFIASTTVARSNKKYRYVRETMSGSNYAATNYWAEFEVFDSSGVNVALGRVFTTDHTSTTGIEYLNDGYKVYDRCFTTPAGKYIQLDLGSPMELSRINTVSYWGDGRQLTTKIEVSVDGVVWEVIYSGSYSPTYYSTGRAFAVGNAGLELLDSTITIGSGNDPNAYDNTAVPRGDKLVLVESGTATPTSTINSFGENWINFAWRGQSPQNPKVGRLAGPNSGTDIGGTSGSYLKAANFTFGLDPQMAQSSAGTEYVTTPFPGSIFNGYNAYSLANNTPTVEEFVGTLPKMTDGRIYTRNKISSLDGTTLECNNTFLIFGHMPNAFNTSYVTLDGTEYVVVMTNGVDSLNSYGALAFELRP